MALSLLEQAKKYFAKKNYTEVISLLQPHILEYKDSFDYHLYLGLSYMYTGEIAFALDYFSGAKKIRPNDPVLLSAQGTLFLRKGDTNKAVHLYLQALDNDPNCQTAKKGLEFLQYNNTPEKIGDFIHSGEIKSLYPDPTNSYKKKKTIIIAIVSFFTVFLLALIFPMLIKTALEKLSQFEIAPKRRELPELVLEKEEKKEVIEVGNDFSLLLTKDEILKTYERAQKYFQAYRDNLAQYEVNRILLSNANNNIKKKAKLLSDYFEVPDFKSLKDNFEYTVVEKQPEAYINCYVIWRGLPKNIITGEYNIVFDLFVGYDKKTTLQGVVPVFCQFVAKVDPETPIEVLGKLEVKKGQLCISGVSIYQSTKPLRNTGL